MLPFSRILLAGTAGLALLLAVTLAPISAPAQPTSPKQPPAQKQPNANLALPVVDRLPTTTTPQTTQLSGEVVDTTHVSFGDTRVKHFIAWIRTPEGELRAVDLGPANGERAVTVKKGERITLTGKIWPVIETRRAEVFFASEVRNGEQSVSIPRPYPTGNIGGGAEAAQSLKGEVLKTKQVDWRGSDRRELVILLKTEEDKQVVADLGPTVAFKDASVKSGSSILLSGQFREFKDRQVFFATEAKIGGKTINIRRDVPPKADAQPNGGSNAGNRRVLTGTIRSIDEAASKDGSGERLLLLIRGQDNRYAIADLGPAASARKYDLRIGDVVTVSGPVSRVQDRPVIKADSLSTHRKTHWISRPK